jgi:hypothetical protein
MKYRKYSIVGFVFCGIASVISNVHAATTVISSSPLSAMMCNQTALAWQQFLDAVKHGRVDLAESILDKGLKTNEIDATKLYYYESDNHSLVVGGVNETLLLYHMVRLMAALPEKEKYSLYTCITKLVAKHPYVMNEQDLYWAAMYGDAKILQLVVDRMSKYHSNDDIAKRLNKPDGHAFSYYNIAHNDLDTHQSSTLTPLMAVVRKYSRVLFTHSQEKDCIRGRLLDNIKLLLKKGSSPTVVCNVRVRKGAWEVWQADKTPLEIAIDCRDTKLVKLMLPEVDLCKDNYGRTLIEYVKKCKANLGYWFVPIKAVQELNEIIGLITRAYDNQQGLSHIKKILATL